MLRLPAAPLKDEIRRKIGRGQSVEQIATRIGICPRTIDHLLADQWVSDLRADRMALALGLHPAILWPTEW